MCEPHTAWWMRRQLGSMRNQPHSVTSCSCTTTDSVLVSASITAGRCTKQSYVHTLPLACERHARITC